MQYNPKLKKAMEEIKAIVTKYDIGASVVLHAPTGHSEFLNHINTSYSCMFFEGDKLRIRTKGRSHDEVKSTVNMITHFEDVNGMLAKNYSRMKEMLRGYIEIDEEPGQITGHTQQNN